MLAVEVHCGAHLRTHKVINKVNDVLASMLHHNYMYLDLGKFNFTCMYMYVSDTWLGLATAVRVRKGSKDAPKTGSEISGRGSPAGR